MTIANCVVLFMCFWACSSGRGPLMSQFIDHDVHMTKTGEDPGQPLFLTPFIENGEIRKGQQLSAVEMPGWSGRSHAGFLTVDKKYNSNLFFWFFPAQENPDTAPVLLWLQGGPGGSSLFGLFVENGPFTVTKDLKLEPKPWSWNKKYSMLYVDNPVGTGFSFTGYDAGYCSNETRVAEHMYNALTQFFLLFPMLAKNDFYMTGESYAGKYIPAIAYKIYKENNRGVNLKGVAIGDGFSDPITMLPEYAPFLFQIGLLDENQRNYFAKKSSEAVSLIKSEHYVEAVMTWEEMSMKYSTWSGLNDMYNYMRVESPADFKYYGGVLQLPAVRRAIHVGNLTYHAGDVVRKHLQNDLMQSVKPWLAVVMEKYKVCIYSGQLDIIVALPLTEAMLQTVEWSGQQEYLNAERFVWRLHPNDTDVAGYVRQVGSFYQVAVRGGGHILPYDQPERSFDMIDRFINDRAFA